MHRRFSSLIKSPMASGLSAVDFDDDTESKVSTIVRDEPLPPASTKIKRVDCYYSKWSKAWKYKVFLIISAIARHLTSTPVEHELEGDSGDAARPWW